MLANSHFLLPPSYDVLRSTQAAHHVEQQVEKQIKHMDDMSSSEVSLPPSPSPISAFPFLSFSVSDSVSISFFVSVSV